MATPSRERSPVGARRIAVEILLIVLIGSGAGAALNAFRPAPLPYLLPGSVLEIESGVRAVFIREAYRLFEAGEYVFVDARDEAEFRAGHIEGALSLPAESFAALYPELQIWAAGQPLLVYGGSENLLAADELARALREQGEEQVLIFAAGFEGWHARGYPVEAGDAGRLSEDAE